MWMCAAMPGPDRCENVRVHVIFALSLASSTTVPVYFPVAPAGTPVGFGTSELAFSFADTPYDSCDPASASPANTSASTATAPITFVIGPPSIAYLGSSGDREERIAARVGVSDEPRASGRR